MLKKLFKRSILIEIIIPILFDEPIKVCLSWTYFFFQHLNSGNLIAYIRSSQSKLLP